MLRGRGGTLQIEEFGFGLVCQPDIQKIRMGHTAEYRQFNHLSWLGIKVHCSPSFLCQCSGLRAFPVSRLFLFGFWCGKKKYLWSLGISCSNGMGIEYLQGASFWHERSMQCPLPLRRSLCSMYGKWNIVEHILFGECLYIFWLASLICKYKYNNFCNLHLPAFITLSNKWIFHIAQKQEHSHWHQLQLSLADPPFQAPPSFFLLFQKCRAFWYYITKITSGRLAGRLCIWSKARCCSGETLIWQSTFQPQDCQVPACVPPLVRIPWLFWTRCRFTQALQKNRMGVKHFPMHVYMYR